MDFDKDSAILAFKLLATTSAGVFTGGAIYINVVEHPARMTSDPSTALRAWRPSFVRAASFQSKLAMISTLSSVSTYLMSRGTSKEDLWWLGSGALFFSVFPFTVAFIRPINNILMETEQCIKEKDDDWIEDKLSTWNLRHACRSGAALFAFGIMVYRLAKGN